MFIKTLAKNVLPTSLVYWLKDIKSLIQRTGAYHEEVSAFKERFTFYKQFISPGDIVFDVGANSGNRIRPFLELKSTVVAVEPQMECSAYLKYRFGNKIDVVEKGLGATFETKTFFVSSINTVSTFSKDWIDAVKVNRFKNIEWNETREIEIITMDSLIAQFGAPAFTKIDVEGFELEVLKGLTKPVKYLSIEYPVPEQVDKLKAILLYLHGLDNKVKFNYFVGESMSLTLNEWTDFSTFLVLISTSEFSDTNFGDIYVSMNP